MHSSSRHCKPPKALEKTTNANWKQGVLAAPSPPSVPLYGVRQGRCALFPLVLFTSLWELCDEASWKQNSGFKLCRSVAMDPIGCKSTNFYCREGSEQWNVFIAFTKYMASCSSSNATMYLILSFHFYSFAPKGRQVVNAFAPGVAK
jgi:hypothetical protein